jgi:hypothetical protein
MIFERLKQNIRLLEQLSIFSFDQDAIPGLIPDTAEYLFLSGTWRSLPSYRETRTTIMPRKRGYNFDACDGVNSRQRHLMQGSCLKACC